MSRRFLRLGLRALFTEGFSGEVVLFRWLPHALSGETAARHGFSPAATFQHGIDLGRADCMVDGVLIGGGYFRYRNDLSFFGFFKVGRKDDRFLFIGHVPPVPTVMVFREV